MHNTLLPIRHIGLHRCVRDTTDSILVKLLQKNFMMQRIKSLAVVDNIASVSLKASMFFNIISFCTSGADSVEHPFLKPCWRSDKMLCLEKKLSSRGKIIFSKPSHSTGRTEMGLSLKALFLSPPFHAAISQTLSAFHFVREATRLDCKVKYKD